MPYPSSFPPVSIPDLDLWTFLFERKDKPFPSSKGTEAGVHSARIYTESPKLTIPKRS